MAAILCKSIGQVCQAVCDVLTLPCRACGIGCKSCAEVFASPFFPYLAVTLGLNVPAVVYGLRGIPSWASCPLGSHWLVANAFLAMIHLLAAWYMVHKIRQDTEASQLFLGATPGTTTTSSTTSAAAAAIPYNYQSTAATSHTASTATTATTTNRTSGLLAVTTGTDDAAVVASKMEKGSYQPPRPDDDVIVVSATPVVVGTTPATAPTITTTPVSSNFHVRGGVTREIGARNSMTRIRHVLCYDPVVALYICVFVVWIVWQSIGTTRFFKLGAYRDECPNIQDYMIVSVVCGYLYLGLVGMAFLCSLCCLR